MLQKAYDKGIRYLAVEIPKDQQNALDHFLNTGDPSRLQYPLDKIQTWGYSLAELMKTAQKVGIRVLCMDVPQSRQGEKEYRESELAANFYALHQFGTGKVLAVFGGDHAKVSSSSFKSVASRLKQRNISVGSIVLENRNFIEFVRRQGSEKPELWIHAFSKYIGSDGIWGASIALPTKALGSLTYTPEGGEVTTYSQAFDYVFFLNDDNSKVPIMPPPPLSPAERQELEGKLDEALEKLKRLEPVINFV